jgi:hypothetical protein
MNFLDFVPLSFFQWSEDTFIGHFIKKQSMWGFAVTETIHIIALSILLGSTLVVDLRLLGYGMKHQSLAKVSRVMNPWTWGSFIVMVVTGITMFDSEAIRMSRSDPFFYKIVLLLLAVLFHATIHRKVTGPNAKEGTGMAKAAAYLSMACWLGVALAGRAIAFL